MARYVCSAVFDPNGLGGYSVTFPDLPGCVTEGDSIDEALHTVAEAMALYLYDTKQDGDETPIPSMPAHVGLPEDASADAFITLIAASTEPVRDDIRNRAVKKTLVIPQRLNEESGKAGINFSQTLQSALKDRLGMVGLR